MRAGFPHSDISGSMLVCQLPAAFRRLPRPSSPVIAKASTTCTQSLDPITLPTACLAVSNRHRCLRYPPPPTKGTAGFDTIKPNLALHVIEHRSSYRNSPSQVQPRATPDSLYFFRIVKEQPIFPGQ